MTSNTVQRGDGIDISHWNTITDGFAGAKAAGALFVMMKATDGTHMVDVKFHQFRAAAKKQGLLIGCYHFLQHNNAAAQADHFINTVGDLTGVCLMLDWEKAGATEADAHAFCQRVFERIKAYPTVYSYSGFMAPMARAFNARKAFWSKTRLWIANYNDKVTWLSGIWPKWWMWQFTGDGHGPRPHDVPGSGHNIDINRYSGERTALAADWPTIK